MRINKLLSKAAKLILAFTMVLTLLHVTDNRIIDDVSAVNYNSVASNTIIDSSYSQLIQSNGTVTVENYSSAYWSYAATTYEQRDSNGNKTEDYAYIFTYKGTPGNTGNALNGYITVRYPNAIKYGDTWVDAIVRLNDIHNLAYTTLIYKSETSTKWEEVSLNGKVWIDAKNIGYLAGMCDVDIQFVKHGTNTPFNVKASMVGIDLDDGQNITSVTGADDIYFYNASSSGIIHKAYNASNQCYGIWTDLGTRTDSFSYTSMMVFLLNGSRFTYKWSNAGLPNENGGYIGFWTQSPFRFSTPGPTKQVDKEQIEVTDYLKNMTSNGKAMLNYTINQYIPLQSKTNYYSIFVINDTLNKGIYSDATKIKIGYYDGSGNLVDDTANWTISLTWSGTGTSRQQQLKCTPSRLEKSANNSTGNVIAQRYYNKEYVVSVPVFVENNSLFSNTTSGTILPNQAYTTYRHDTDSSETRLNSNTVKTEFRYDIRSYHDSGSTITASKVGWNSAVVGTKSATFYYSPLSGYKIYGLKVDGVDVSFNENGGSYTFTNVLDYHSISVISRPTSTEQTPPVKTVDPVLKEVNKYNGTTAKTYTITQIVPKVDLMRDYTTMYTRFEFEDTLKSLDTVQSVKIYKRYIKSGGMGYIPAGTRVEVTSNFDITYAKNSQGCPVVKAVANKFDGNLIDKNIYLDYSTDLEYVMEINTVQSESKLNEFTTKGNGTLIYNSASFIYGYSYENEVHRLLSNEVVSEYIYDIISSHDTHSHITDSMKGSTALKGGENGAFTYGADSGYEVASLKVDNKDVQFDAHGGTYTFENVSAYHEIKVTSRKIRSNTPEPVKSVDPQLSEVNAYTGTTLKTYTIDFDVPQQDSYYYYDKFGVIDNMLDIDKLVSVKVYSDGVDVTGKWNVYSEDHSFALDMKNHSDSSMYGKSYTVKAVVNESWSSLSGYTTTGQGTVIENMAQLKIHHVNDSSSEFTYINSNKVRSTFVYDIISKHDAHTTITESMKGESAVVGGNNAVFNYGVDSGYVIKSLKVDGKDVSFSKNGGAYTFTNVSAYHEIEIISEAIQGIAPTISKEVTPATTEVNAYTGSTTKNYTINFTMPSMSNNSFSSFKIEDTLKALDTVSSVKVMKGTTDVTAQFTVTVSTKSTATTAQKVTVIPKTLTSTGNYKVVIVTSQTWSQLSSFTDSTNGTVIPNKASLTYSFVSGIDTASHTIDSNEVKSTYTYTIKSSHDSNSTITATMTGIKGGSNKTFTYAPASGYEIISLKVDGKEIAYNKAGGTYTFTNISAYHEIEVASKISKPDDKIITITKTIDKTFNSKNYVGIDTANGSPIFIYRISGTDTNGVKHVYHRVISFKDDVSNNNAFTLSKWEKSITLTVPDGDYVVEELHNSRFTISMTGKIQTKTNATNSEENTSDPLGTLSNKVNLRTVGYDTNKVYYHNVQTNFKDLSDNDIKVNHIN